MVLMSVSNEHSADSVLVLNHIGKVRNDNIDAQHRFIRKCKSAVHDEHIVAALIDGHVLSDFVQTAQRDNADDWLFAVLFPPSLGFAAALTALLFSGSLCFLAALCCFFSSILLRTRILLFGSFLFLGSQRVLHQLDGTLHSLCQRIGSFWLSWFSVVASGSLLCLGRSLLRIRCVIFFVHLPVFLLFVLVLPSILSVISRVIVLMSADFLFGIRSAQGCQGSMYPESPHPAAPFGRSSSCALSGSICRFDDFSRSFKFGVSASTGRKSADLRSFFVFFSFLSLYQKQGSALLSAESTLRSTQIGVSLCPKTATAQISHHKVFFFIVPFHAPDVKHRDGLFGYGSPPSLCLSMGWLFLHYTLVPCMAIRYNGRD